MEKVIEVKDLTKTYKLYEKNTDRLKEIFDFHNKKKYYQEFNALEHITFSVGKGETVGIIGTNGSGKSTILKIITGVLNPTKGDISINGRISALLELGAGFNMEYSGIQNIYLNGMMMGLTREEVDKRLSKIIEFAEIGDFINQPVKTYSSGMFARLAFAVSINVDPDILIVDEALSVGDMYFQEKCFEQMKRMVKSGATILFVSHSLPAVRNFCNRVIWIEKGKLKLQGPADKVCEAYKSYLDEKNNQHQENVDTKKVDLAVKEKNKILIREAYLNKEDYYTNENIELDIALEFRAENLKYGVGIIIRNAEGKIVTLFNTIRDDIQLQGKHTSIKLIIPDNDLLEGTYFVSVNICDDMAMYPYDVEDYIAKFKIKNVTNKTGIPIADGEFRAKHEWIY